jgi:choline-sulfatase
MTALEAAGAAGTLGPMGLRGVAIVILTAGIACAAAGDRAGRAAEAGRPNVLFIAVDDLRPEAAASGSPLVRTPHIDRIAARGTTFDRAYCQQAVCSPSRSSLMTGRRPDATRVWDLDTHFRTALPDAVTLGQHFRNHGYVVQGMGKIYHGGFDDPPTWSVPWQMPDAPQWVLPESRALRAAARPDRKGRKRGPAFEAADVPDDTYLDGKTARLAAQTLRDLAAGDAPFFLAVGFARPHLPFVAPARYWDLYDPAEIYEPAFTRLPDGAPDFVGHTNGELRSYAGIPPAGPIPDDLARRLRHGYYAAVSYVDAQIGIVLDALEATGRADDTVIVLWGDHGWQLGEHGLWHKHTNFELAVRAPLVIAAPGQRAAGSRTLALAEFVDVYPTLADVCGLPVPPELDGTSLRPVLDDPHARVHEVAISQYPRTDPDGRSLMGYSIRDDRWRLTLWRDRAQPVIVARELYDELEDPHETVNLAARADHAAVVERLTAFLPPPIPASAPSVRRKPPNVMVILADDLGFSDLGCHGGEIDTPCLDRLAAGGLRFTQGYSTGRCWPSRGALLTGFYPQAIRRDRLPGGAGGAQGQRPAWARLLPELLQPAGYRSYHSGKWHVDGAPRGQGFARSLDVKGAGQSNYFDPAGVVEEGRPGEPSDDFYTTTAIGSHAVKCLREHAAAHRGTPFFHYVAFTAPHFPLQAPQPLIDRYRERYRVGWDAVRQARWHRLDAAGIVMGPLSAVERHVGPPYSFPGTAETLGAGEVMRPVPWSDLTAEQQAFQVEKMAIHAAMVDALDQQVGRILAELEAMEALDDTLILFASDNGASAEIMIRGEGHDPAAPPGSRGTFLCLGPGWSNAANTPFRRHKTWVHEGGIASPWIVHWPAGIATRGGLRHQPVHLVDVTPTVLDLAGVTPPAELDGKTVPRMQGRSFAPAILDPEAAPAHELLWWCHDDHRAVRVGDWKLVADANSAWELYDLAADRTETRDLAAAEPGRVAALAADWERMAADCRALAANDGRAAAAPEPPAERREERRTAVATTGGGPSPPNVVIIFTDDMGYGDPTCYGGTVAPTPHIDRLAREGVRFTDFYVAQPVCSASRAALLTGCYPNRLGIHGALGPRDTHGLAAAETTLAELLRDRGYRTACVGKWHLGHRPPFLPTRQGFDEYLGLPYSNDMWPRHPEAKPGTFPPLPLFENETIVDPDVTPEAQATLTRRYADRAVDFIERAADGPFFLYLAHSMPHVPLFAGPEFIGRAPGGLYGDVVAEIDASVGAVLAALDRTGHRDDTLVIFTSDNGPWLSYGNHAGSTGGLREGKGTVFEGGVRVPCVARLPGVIPAGRVCDRPLMTIDMLPTIAALTGRPLPADTAGFCTVAGRRIDGHDRWPLFTGGAEADGPADPPAYFFWYHRGELQAVRAGDWKLHFPHTARTMEGQDPGADGLPGKYRPLAVGRELYDLRADPAESHDAAAAHPDVVARLERLADAARAELGDALTGVPGSGLREPDRVDSHVD